MSIQHIVHTLSKTLTELLQLAGVGIKDLQLHRESPDPQNIVRVWKSNHTTTKIKIPSHWRLAGKPQEIGQGERQGQ